MVLDGDTKWIEAYRQAPEDPNAPLASISPALNRLLAKGIDPRDLTEVVRVMQYDVLFAVCYLIDDPSAALEGLDDLRSELSKIGWALFEVDEDNHSSRPMDGLHESLLETDPTGREMRPAMTDR